MNSPARAPDTPVLPPRIQERQEAAWSPPGLSQIDYPAHDVPDPATSNFVLCLVRRGKAKSTFGFGGRRWSGELQPGMFAPLTPPHVCGEISLNAPQRHLVLSFSHLTVGAILGTRGDDLGAVHEDAFRDPLLSQVCLALWEAANDGRPQDLLFEEYALASLIVGLARRSGRLKPTSRSARPLSNAEWVRIAGYVTHHLDGDLTLSALSSLVEMTQFAFIRSFKARTGCSPHQYVLRQRIEHARNLLETSSFSLADIALLAGFSDQAHMTSTFTRLTGETPGQLKRRIPV